MCLKDSLYEVGRAYDVFTLAGQLAILDDGEIYSCDVTPHGKERRIYTMRTPLLGVISAITPFNHPLNMVAHKLAPAIATNNRVVLKPTELTPLTALLLADVLYEAGLPPEMLSVVTGNPSTMGDAMITDPDADLVTFTGSVRVGKHIGPADAGMEQLGVHCIDVAITVQIGTVATGRQGAQQTRHAALKQTEIAQIDVAIGVQVCSRKVLDLEQVSHELLSLGNGQMRRAAVPVVWVLRGNHVHERRGRPVVKIRRRLPQVLEGGRVKSGQQNPDSIARGRRDRSHVVQYVRIGAQIAVSELRARMTLQAAGGGGAKDGLAGQRVRGHCPVRVAVWTRRRLPQRGDIRGQRVERRTLPGFRQPQRIRAL